MSWPAKLSSHWVRRSKARYHFDAGKRLFGTKAPSVTLGGTEETDAPDQVQSLLMCPTCNREMRFFGIEPGNDKRDLFTFECTQFGPLDVRGVLVSEVLGNQICRSFVTGALERDTQELVMPVLLVPLLVGIPVVLVGGYFIVHAMH